MQLFSSLWAQLGAVGILAGAVWMVLTGRLISRKEHERVLGQQKERGDDWRDAYRAMAARATIQDQQMGEILTFVRSNRGVT